MFSGILYVKNDIEFCCIREKAEIFKDLNRYKRCGPGVQNLAFIGLQLGKGDYPFKRLYGFKFG